jgi:uncharacterized damage-inducible protein DinB
MTDPVTEHPANIEDEERLAIPNVPGIGPEITLFLTIMQELRRETTISVQGLDVEALHWAPPGARSSAALLWDIAQTELYWIREVFGGVQAPADLWRTAGRDADGRTRLEPPREPVQFYMDALDRVRHDSLRILEISKDGALDNHYIHPSDGNSRSCQGRWILYHVIENEAYHRGQIGLNQALKRHA